MKEWISPPTKSSVHLRSTLLIPLSTLGNPEKESETPFRLNMLTSLLAKIQNPSLNTVLFYFLSLDVILWLVGFEELVSSDVYEISKVPKNFLPRCEEQLKA